MARRKSFKVAPGIKVNLNSKSASVSFGGKGYRQTYSTSGRKTTSISTPVGTYTKSSGSGRKKSSSSSYSESSAANYQNEDYLNDIFSGDSQNSESLQMTPEEFEQAKELMQMQSELKMKEERERAELKMKQDREAAARQAIEQERQAKEKEKKTIKWLGWGTALLTLGAAGNLVQGNWKDFGLIAVATAVCGFFWYRKISKKIRDYIKKTALHLAARDRFRVQSGAHRIGVRQAQIMTIEQEYCSTKKDSPTDRGFRISQVCKTVSCTIAPRAAGKERKYYEVR